MMSPAQTMSSAIGYVPGPEKSVCSEHSEREPSVPADYFEGTDAVRRQIDCLIAAIAIRQSVVLLHADRDFTSLAECSSLQIHH